MNQEDFRWSSRRSGPYEPSVAYPGRVDHEQVAWRDQLDKLLEVRILQLGSFDCALIAVDYQEAAVASLGERLLGNKLGGELIVEVSGAETLRRQRSWLGPGEE
jgi:hypothetical protein